MALWHYFFKLKVHCTLGCSYVLLFGFLSICININVRVRNLIKICKYSIEEVTFSCTLIHKRSLQQVAPIGNVIAPSLKVLVKYTRVACQMDEQCLKLPPLITGIIICVTFYTEHSHPHLQLLARCVELRKCHLLLSRFHFRSLHSSFWHFHCHN